MEGHHRDTERTNRLQPSVANASRYVVRLLLRVAFHADTLPIKGTTQRGAKEGSHATACERRNGPCLSRTAHDEEAPIPFTCDVTYWNVSSTKERSLCHLSSHRPFMPISR
jgi:hypothetical protein